MKGNNAIFLFLNFLNIFQKIFKNSLAAKIFLKIFIEYNQMIQKCMDTFVWDLLILCEKVKFCYIIVIYFLSQYGKNDKIMLKCFQ